jgi:4-hydroxy-2-oxovalerate aldolase
VSIKIIDCTLRDGSHAINYQFSEELTKEILLGLEKAGIQWIEMGHGKGLGASKKYKKPAALSDEMYIDLAKNCLTKSNFGFLCQKEFSEKKDIKSAAKRGVNFVRIGSDINEIDENEDYIKYAKDQGLIVFIALKKGYVISPNHKKYIEILNKLNKWGADLVTIMDSAGTMLPHEVKQYIIQGKINSNISIGFHAHNNLQLGIANIIAAIEAGADAVDVSIGGLGRSSGNAPTEILAVIFEKYGWGKLIDYRILSDLNDKFIFPLIKGKNRFSSEELTFGFAGFHSGFYPIIENIIQNNPSIDYRDLIIAVSKIEKVKVNKKLVEEIANNLLNKK